MHSTDVRIIVRDLSLAAALVGLMSGATLLVVIALGEPEMIVPFAVPTGISFALATAIYLPFRRAPEAQLKHGLIIAALGWFLAALLGALPFFIAAHGPSADAVSVFRGYGNALFESMSGFTTTGLSVVSRPDLLPRSFQWWRSFMQWIGGVGIIVLMLGLMSTLTRPGKGIFFAERDAKIHPSISSTIRTMWWIYILYTFVGVVVLWGVGMDIWDSVNHSMTALSTGGFSTSPASMGQYTGWGVRLTILLLMLFGATSFATHYDLLQGRKDILRGNFYQAGWLLVFAAGFALILVVENALGNSSASSASSVFQAISAVTTTGFQTESVRDWSEGAKLIMILAMFIGGATGSTAGGIKVMRAVLLARGMGWWLSRMISSPKKVLQFRVGHEKLSSEAASYRVQGAAVIFSAWLVCTLAGTLVLMHVIPDGFTLADSLFEVVSAQSTVGLSIGITHGEMSTIAKLVLIINMWMGRLEVLPILMLFRAIISGLE